MALGQFPTKQKAWKRLANHGFGISNPFGLLLIVLYGSIAQTSEGNIDFCLHRE
jgi:hypothetical protein